MTVKILQNNILTPHFGENGRISVRSQCNTTILKNFGFVLLKQLIYDYVQANQ